MYHPRLTGSHYDMGFKYGGLMNKSNADISQMLEIMELDNEKREFTAECVAICREVYPEVIDEIQGMADSLKIPFIELASCMFCMYCRKNRFDRGCTGFAGKDGNNIIFGRNGDFFIETRHACESAFYRPENGYCFIGNSTAMTEMEDGYNEHGLAVGLTFIIPRVVKPGLNAGILLRYMLEKCRTVKEALEALNSFPRSSSETFTMIDKTGDMAAVECNCEKVVVLERVEGENFVVSVNHFMSQGMKEYWSPAVFNSEERYETATRALREAPGYSVQLAMDILAGKYGFMCQYDRKLHFDTLWSTVYDLTNDRIFRAEGNPSKAEFKEDFRLARVKGKR